MNAKKCLFIMTFCVFLTFGGSAFSEEMSFPPPDAEVLQGPQNESNQFARQEFYAKKSIEMEQATRESREYSDPMWLIVRQFELTMEEKLGADFSFGARTKLSSIQHNMLVKQATIDAQYLGGKISKKEYQEQTETLTTKALRASAKVLDDQQFETLFGFPKSDIQESTQKFLSDTQ
jgi:hypothetical protein